MTRGRRVLLVGAAVSIVVGGVLVAPSAAMAAMGRVIVNAQSVTDSADFKGVVVTCPAGKKALGGGGAIVNGGHFVQLYAIRPTDDGSGIFAAGDELPTGYAGLWSVKAWAVCGTMAGYEIVSADGPFEPGDPSTSVTANCPAGKKVIGAGGVAFKSNFVLDSVDVAADLGSVFAETFSYDGLGHPGGGPGLVAYAICVTPTLFQQRLTAVSAAGAADEVSVSATCPAGLAPYGATGGMTGALGRSVIQSLTTTRGIVAITAVEQGAGPTAAWSAYVHTVCALP
jgi:hypothetical protein